MLHHDDESSEQGTANDDKGSEQGTPTASQMVVENLTAKRIIIEESAPDLFTLAPFEKRTVDPATFSHFRLDRLAAQGMIAVLPPPEKRSAESIFQLVFWGGIAYLAGGGYVHSKLDKPPNQLATKTVWMAQHYWLVAGIAFAVCILGLVAVYFRRGTDVLRMLAQWATFLVTALLSFGVPALIVYHFGGGKEVLANGPAGAIVGRGLQLLVIAIGSLLPALMYYLFDRQKLGTIRSRLEQQLLRLDPNVENLHDVRAKYGPQMDEIYGSARAAEARLVRATRWPILVATVLTMAGWMLVLPFFRSVNTQNPDDVLSYFQPPRNALVFAFLGSYLFTLNSILRRYVRGDLKPKAYSSISVRIFVVMILAWVIELAAAGSGAQNAGALAGVDSSVALILAFFIGIIPETGLTWIQELVRKRIGKLALRIEEKHPLTDLEGIDIYDRGRLLDEGVTNVESLAHYDLIDLILDTRIPVPRIVDWLDQAILYLHVAAPNSGGSKDTADDEIPVLRRNLRSYGIRTASDLLAAFQKAQERKQAAEFLKELRDGFPCKDVEPLQVVLDTMMDDEWFDYVRHWRANRISEDYRIAVPMAELPQHAADEPSLDGNSNRPAERGAAAGKT